MGGSALPSRLQLRMMSAAGGGSVEGTALRSTALEPNLSVDAQNICDRLQVPDHHSAEARCLLSDSLSCILEVEFNPATHTGTRYDRWDCRWAAQYGPLDGTSGNSWAHTKMSRL